jgi:hypothetical protein
MAFLVLGYCNILLAALPWYQAQLRAYMTQLMAMMPTMPGQTPVLVPFNWTMVLASCIFGLIINGLVFLLLHRHRDAFHAPAPPPAPMLEA